MPGTGSGRLPKVVVVANPTAGTLRPQLTDELASLCDVLSEHRWHWTTRRGDATDAASAAARAGADIVIAVGGDGTVRDVAAGLMAADTASTALLVVPAGTGNSSYLAQWGHRDWPAAVTAALRGRADVALRRLDLARWEELDSLVLLGACSGLIAQALVTARSIPEGGREKYRIALARTADDFEPYPGRVTVDDVVIHTGPTVLANVGGGTHRGGTYNLLPKSVLDDGQLDVCVIGAEVDPRDVPAHTLDGAHLGMDGVVYGRGKRIVVERTDGRPLCMEHDGELKEDLGSTATFEVLPGAMPTLCAATALGAL